MSFPDAPMRIGQLRDLYPEKFPGEEEVFRRIRRGDRIFVGTGCAEPRHLVNAFMEYARANPKAFFDAELSHVLALGLTPHSFEAYRPNFRQDFFYIADSTRDAVNTGMADYTPVFLSQVPRLFRRRLVAVDVAFIQVSPPGANGEVSLGISVDVMPEAIRHCPLVIAQVHTNMPFVHGEGLVDPEDIDFFIHHDEPLLEYRLPEPDETTLRIGAHAAKIIPDGSTLHVGYGRVPDGILACLGTKRHLGVHTELLSAGIMDLMRRGVADNSCKTLDRGKTVACMCLGTAEVYRSLHDNPSISFMPAEYTNNPLVIARQDNMVAIESALQIDLTGQATAESIGSDFQSGIGGRADFLRTVASSPTGKAILALPSTARSGSVSRIVPFLPQGAGVTCTRGAIHYWYQYGICYLHGKKVRERAMSLIAIAHP
jgi:acyl-CoA hydrolase